MKKISNFIIEKLKKINSNNVSNDEDLDDIYVILGYTAKIHLLILEYLEDEFKERMVKFGSNYGIIMRKDEIKKCITIKDFKNYFVICAKFKPNAIDDCNCLKDIWNKYKDSDKYTFTILKSLYINDIEEKIYKS